MRVNGNELQGRVTFSCQGMEFEAGAVELAYLPGNVPATYSVANMTYHLHPKDYFPMYNALQALQVALFVVQDAEMVKMLERKAPNLAYCARAMREWRASDGVEREKDF